MSEQESTTDGEVAGIERAPTTEIKTCANCGTIVDEFDWFPIRGRTDENGEFRIYSFCSDECVESWEQP